MLQAALQYWCLVLLCSLMSSSATYLPRVSNRVPSLQRIAQVLERDEQHQAHSIVKRASMRNYRAMALLPRRLQRRFRGRRRKSKSRRRGNMRDRQDHPLVRQMFREFDIDGNNLIEYGEFAVVIKMLNLVKGIR